MSPFSVTTLVWTSYELAGTGNCSSFPSRERTGNHLQVGKPSTEPVILAPCPTTVPALFTSLITRSKSAPAAGPRSVGVPSTQRTARSSEPPSGTSTVPASPPALPVAVTAPDSVPAGTDNRAAWYVHACGAACADGAMPVTAEPARNVAARRTALRLFGLMSSHRNVGCLPVQSSRLLYFPPMPDPICRTRQGTSRRSSTPVAVRCRCWSEPCF